MAGLKVEICLKKNPRRAQIFRYFRYESRNNNKKISKKRTIHFHSFACAIYLTRMLKGQKFRYFATKEPICALSLKTFLQLYKSIWKHCKK